MMLDGCILFLWTGQYLLIGTADSPQQTVVVSSGWQIVVAVVAGLLMAFAFQLLLANFGVAVGITALRFRPSSSSNDGDDPQKEAESASLSQTISSISLVAGLGILLTINTILFAACFLAVKLSLVTDATLGAIVGILIWSTYCLLLTWITSSAAGFLTNAVFSTATSGLRNLAGTVSAALSRSTPQTTPGDAATDVDQELRSALDSLDLEAILKQHLDTIQPSQPDLESIQPQLAQLLEHPTLKALANSPLQHQIDRQTLIDWVNRYTDFSQDKTDQVVDQLEAIWDQVRGDDLQKDQVSDLLESLQKNSEALEASSPNGKSEPLPAKPEPESQSANPLARLQQMDLKHLLQTALSRVDLSDWDVERVWQQLQTLQPKASNQATDQPAIAPFNVIRVDVENYLLNAHPWQLDSDTLQSKFKQILYDPEAAPAQVQPLLEQLDRRQFAHILGEREDLAPERVNGIADQLEAVRKEVLTALQPTPAELAQAQAATTALWRKMESYLRYTSLSKLNPTAITHKLQALAAESQLSPAVLQTQSSSFDPNALLQVLERRQGLESETKNQLMDQIQATWASLQQTSSPLQTGEADDNALGVIANYLQEIDWSTLNLEGIKQDVIKLLGDPKQGTLALGQRLNQVDWSVLGDRLAEQELDQAQIKQALNQVREGVRHIVKTPRRWAIRAQQQSEDLQAQIEDYLHHRDKAEFNLDGIQRDLQRILDDSGTGSAQSWQTKLIDKSLAASKLTMLERSRLKEILQQRPDIPVADVNQIVDQIESTWNQLLEQAQQTQDQLQSTLDEVLSTIRDSLEALNLPKLQTDKLQQELGQLSDLTQVGVDRLRDTFGTFLSEASLETLQDNPLDQLRERLGQLSHEGIEALLNAREDLPREISGQLVEQIEQVRAQMLHQVEALQQATQTRIQDFKQQAQQNVAAVRNAAAIAAWWLFGIAFSSLCTAAAAGALAVIGIELKLQWF